MAAQTTLQKIFYFPLTKIVIGFALLVGAGSLAQFAGKLLVNQTPLSIEVKGGIVGIITAATVLLSYILLYRFYEKRKITELSLASFGKNALIGFSVGLLLQSLVILVIYLSGGYSVIHVIPVSFLIPAFTIALTSAITEELLIRGIVFRITEEKLGTVIALIISALLFGLLHLANHGATLFSAISIALQAGVLLAAAYIFSRNLWLPIFLHFAWNFAEGGIYGVLISGNTVRKSLITSKITGSPLLTGGQFGPENSIQATLLCLIAAIIFLWLAKKNNRFIKPYWENKTLTDRA